MPDYGSEKGFSGEQTNTYTGGSGYVSGSGGGSGGGSDTGDTLRRQEERRKKLQDQLDAQREAYQKQIAIDKEKKRRQEEARLAAEKAAATQQTMMPMGGPGTFPVADNEAAGPIKPRPRPTNTDKGPVQKALDDFLMDIGVKPPDQDYYDRLGERKESSKKALEQSKEDRRSGNNNTQDDSPTTEPSPYPYTGPVFRRDPYASGIGAFGYSPELMQFESQQGAGQVPYYMAAARNAQNPNMSPAFQYAAQNYDILGGSQRTAPRPIEMMSAAERAQILGIGSNFNTPNYNSPYYSPSEQNEFNYYKDMVSSGVPTEVSTGFPGKGGNMSYPIKKYYEDNNIDPSTVGPNTAPNINPNASGFASYFLPEGGGGAYSSDRTDNSGGIFSGFKGGVQPDTTKIGALTTTPSVGNVSPTFSFKYQDAGTHPMSGQKLYGGIMNVEMPDGRIMQYKAGQHNSRQKLKDDFDRMMAGVNSSLRGEILSVDQNYGSQSVDVSPTDVTMSGGTLSGPNTFTVRDKSTGQNQIVDQRGIRQGDPFYGSVNMLDPNYDPTLDSIVNPITGSPMGMMSAAPQQRSQFNSMGELMDFQSQNPTMNLMGEYQRLSELE